MSPDNSPSLDAIESAEPSPYRSIDSGLYGEAIQASSSMNPILASTSTAQESLPEIKLSKKRWLVLAAFSIFGFTVALIDSTSSILSLFLKLIDLTVKEYSYIQPFFYYIMVASAFPTAIFTDKYGVKLCLHIAAGLLVVHGLLRAVLLYPDFPHHEKIKLPCYILSSLVGVEMLTIFFLLPLKVSETWFSEKERTVAWAFMITQMSVGSCFASFVYPRIITKVEDFRIIAYITIVSVMISAVTSLTFVTQAEPDHPPNERVAKAKVETPLSFRTSMMKMLKHRDILVHMLHLSVLESLSMSVSNVYQPMLESIGYSAVFIGNLMTATGLVAIFMQIVLAVFVAGIKHPVLVCKLGSLLLGILYIGYLMTLICPQPTWIFITCTLALTVWKAWITSNFTNMTAHLSCGAVSQATIIGLSMSLTVFVMTITNLTFTKLIVISDDNQSSYTYSLTFICFMTLINEIFYLGFFYGKPAVKSEDNDQQSSISDLGN